MNNNIRNKKNVLMIAYTYYGTDPRVIRGAEAALSAGFNVDCIVLKKNGDPDQEWIRGVRVIHLKQGRYRGVGLVFYLISYLRFFLKCFIKTTALQLEKHFNVVHVHNMPDFFVFCAILPKLMGAKILLDIHDPMPDTFMSKFKSDKRCFFYRVLLWIERASASFADKILTVSDPVKEYILVKQHGLHANSIQVVANFADDKIFLQQEPKRIDSVLRLVYHGTILERYGLQCVMQALTKIRHKDRLLVKIIGEGDYSTELKNLIELLQLKSIVDFENQTHPVHELPKILKEYNIGLVPLAVSTITNFALPLKLLEYLSLGMTSITVRNAAIGYYFGEDDLIFYEPDDSDSLSLILDQLAESPEILCRYQIRAKAIRDKFLWSHEKQKYISLLRNLS